MKNLNITIFGREYNVNVDGKSVSYNYRGLAIDSELMNVNKYLKDEGFLDINKGYYIIDQDVEEHY